MVKVTHNALSGTASVWHDITAGLPGNAVTHIAVDPDLPRKHTRRCPVFQTGHVFLTQDSGKTWTDIGGNLPDNPPPDGAPSPANLLRTP
jgi:hypothetical protein